MSFKPILPMRGMSGAGVGDDTSSAHSVPTTSTPKDPVKWMWCETQWVNLSLQAKNLSLSKYPYFDSETMLLSKEVNARLWKQLIKLYNVLGQENAPYASPVLINIGPKQPPELRWYSYLDDSKGDEAEVYDR